RRQRRLIHTALCGRQMERTEPVTRRTPTAYPADPQRQPIHEWLTADRWDRDKDGGDDEQCGLEDALPGDRHHQPRSGSHANNRDLAASQPAEHTTIQW